MARIHFIHAVRDGSGLGLVGLLVPQVAEQEEVQGHEKFPTPPLSHGVFLGEYVPTDSSTPLTHSECQWVGHVDHGGPGMF